MDIATIVVLSTITLTVTSYQSVPNQTDASPFITSTGDRVSNTGCAISRDLLDSGKVKYGDVLHIERVGFRIVNDTMHPRIKNTVDVWVPTYQHEKKIGKRLSQKVVLIRGKHERTK